MVRISCLAGLSREHSATLMTILDRASLPRPAVVERIDVAEVGRMQPGLLVCDIDNVAVDSLELLRQLRFVLPGCIIIVYTGQIKAAWSLACHLAGANGLLSKTSTDAQLAAGVLNALLYGCYTDPQFAAA